MLRILNRAFAAETRGYVVCSNPRSGSTYLGFLAKSTGKLGVPCEWLRGDGGAASLDYENYTQDESEQVHYVLTDGKTPNGVYGLKMFPEHFDMRTETCWAESLPQLHYVHLVREDIIGQAISLAIARQTGSYVKETPESHEAVYDRTLILNCLRFIAAGEARWRMFFAINKIRPLEITYSRLLENPQREISRIAEVVGVRNAKINRSKFLPTPQRTLRNDLWRKRFTADLHDVRELPRLGIPTLRDTILQDDVVMKKSGCA
ncbi:MAG: Stf0 family sulfotransferase [Pseudomonadota bacterium]